ncbi:MAG: hypothetical protein HC870_02200, partial [Rhizobiales bacterium]|nr:hypothetical protein [Hyphomicrobiales bacterium]
MSSATNLSASGFGRLDLGRIFSRIGAGAHFRAGRAGIDDRDAQGLSRS